MNRRFKSFWCLAVMAYAGAMPAHAGEALAPLLGTDEIGLNDLTALPQWQGALERMAEQQSDVNACERDVDACANPAMVAWRAKIASLSYETPMTRLEAVNVFANTLPRTTDAESHGKEDFWATPVEFITRSGDEEDAAILKYAMLRELGVPADEIRIVLASDLLRNRESVLVITCVEEIPYVLTTSWDTLLSEEQAGFYVPSLSFNEVSRWLHARPIADVAAREQGSR